MKALVNMIYTGDIYRLLICVMRSSVSGTAENKPPAPRLGFPEEQVKFTPRRLAFARVGGAVLFQGADVISSKFSKERSSPPSLSGFASGSTSHSSRSSSFDCGASEEAERWELQSCAYLPADEKRVEVSVSALPSPYGGKGIPQHCQRGRK